MIKSIILPKDTWAEISKQLKTQYPASVMLVRDRMKETLGFTPRFVDYWKERDGGQFYGGMVHEVHLDFFNESARTMFLIKFAHLINEKCKA